MGADLGQGKEQGARLAQQTGGTWPPKSVRAPTTNAQNVTSNSDALGYVYLIQHRISLSFWSHTAISCVKTTVI